VRHDKEDDGDGDGESVSTLGDNDDDDSLFGSIDEDDGNKYNPRRSHK
jgi:hypothetical protein